MASQSSSLAKLAFNIYGNAQTSVQDSPNSSIYSKEDSLVYQCDREVISLTQLNAASSVIIGGKNYLKLLTLDDGDVVNELNILKSVSSRSIININTIKSNLNTIVCGLSSGQLQVYTVSNNSVSLSTKLSDHKRSINSIDFVNDSQIISGSQDGTIKIWDLRTSQKPVLTIQPSSLSDPLRSCQFSSHSSKSTILSVHDSGYLIKLDLRSPHQPERKWNLHSGPALSLHIHPELEFVLTGGRDQKMCVWNYGDSSPGTSRLSPEHMILTYSPVKKVRWSQTLNDQNHYQPNDSDIDKYEDSLSDRDSYQSLNSNPLYNYDFACLYLNDDSTISIYNLNRKFIPKEIIKTPSNKPFQNFIWAKSNNNSRKIWSLTKSNNFITYDLDDHYQQQNVKIPLQELNTVSLDWRHGIGDFAFVNQEKYEYELDDTESLIETDNDDIDQVISFENSHYDELSPKPVSISNPIPVKPGSIPVAINMPYHSSSLGHSPVEKPPLLRSFTHNSMQTKSSSPIPQIRGSNMVSDLPSGLRAGYGFPMGLDLSVRPKLSRNSSHSTMESNYSNGSLPKSISNSQRKLLPVSYASPYVIPISLPLPLNDESTFESLAQHYLTSIPDGFNLIEVCHLNALAAADVHRFRDSQTWKILAISLENNTEFYERKNVFEDQNDQPIQKTEFKAKEHVLESVNTELDNLASSFNSNSSLRTTYGGLGVNSDKNESMDSLAYEKIPVNLESRNSSSHNLKDMMNMSRGASFTAVSSPSKTKLTRNFVHKSENENAIVDDDDIESEDIRRKEGKIEPQNSLSPDRFLETKPGAFMIENSLNIKHQRSFSRSHVSQDLDNENHNIINHAAMHILSQSKPRSIGPGSPKNNNGGCSFSSNGSNPIHGSYRTNSMVSRAESAQEWRRKLRDVLGSFNEKPESIITKSELTKAINENTKSESALTKPWVTTNLLLKALEYSYNQGDIVLSSTLTLLFYEKLPTVFDFLIVLNSLGIYIETLQRKRLFVIAANIIKEAPTALINELRKMNQSETDLRFFCCHCEKLLINEKSKKEMNNENVEFGYWYCDNCSRIQLNCIYCCEPCKGLAVVVSLKCGHRGHFGCLREWFIDGANIECPGGCDNTIF